MFGNNRNTHLALNAACLLLILSILAGCSINLPISGQTGSTPTMVPEPTQIPTPQAEVYFKVRIPAETPVGQAISLDILDEVTGLALNAKQNLMAPVESGIYSVKVIAPVGAVLKYRYSRLSSPPAIEYNSIGSQVRYRLFYVTGPASVEDQVSGWTDLRYAGSSGRIQGVIRDGLTNNPVDGILVEAGGVTTFTASDGSFLLEGLPPGKHNLFAYSLDGKYKPFQQEAVVASDSTTPAPLMLEPASQIRVTFNVRVPTSTLNPLPVRLIGNLSFLGNTYADLLGGLSTLANRAPIMTQLPDGRYSLTLNLPAGVHLQYKYSLGDGFWNAEHTSDGQFRLREIILPAQDTIINDVVAAWQTPDSAPVNFSVTVPTNTPSGDYVSIQFSPFGWTEPIPMWPMGNNRWVYILYSPLNMLGNVGYRYCRNDVCGAADDIATAGPTDPGFPFSSSLIPQSFQDTVEHWAWWQPSGQPTTVVATEIQKRGANFMAGIELQTGYHPTWLAQTSVGLQNIKDLGANWVILSPTWHFTRSNPPVLEPISGKDMSSQDLLSEITQSQQRGLNVALHAQTVLDGTGSWWTTGQKDANWWANWFARYRTFALNYADLAAASNVGALVLGDENLLPAYPGGLLPDGTSSSVPSSADQQWKDLIDEIHTHYQGPIYWMLPSSVTSQDAPPFLEKVDGIYFVMDNRLAASNNPSQAELSSAVDYILDNQVKQLKDRFGSAIFIQFRYPSVDGSAQGCLLINNQCVEFSYLDQPVQDNPTQILDLQEQVDIYNAILLSINTRDWINGVISGGYFAPAALQDKSSSIHGKPASDIIWYWYHQLLGS